MSLPASPPDLCSPRLEGEEEARDTTTIHPGNYSQRKSRKHRSQTRHFMSSGWLRCAAFSCSIGAHLAMLPILGKIKMPRSSYGKFVFSWCQKQIASKSNLYCQRVISSTKVAIKFFTVQYLTALSWTYISGQRKRHTHIVSFLAIIEIDCNLPIEVAWFLARCFYQIGTECLTVVKTKENVVHCPLFSYLLHTPPPPFN